jgi:DNA-binding Lrp family transcriptional regulator
LINTIDVLERDIEHKLKNHENIEEIDTTVVEQTAMADPLFENFNMIAKIVASSEEEINQIIKSDIQSLEGVKEVKLTSRPKMK